MLDPKPFVEHAEQATGGRVLAWARARQRLPGAVVGKPGLLCALEDGLAFVEDEIVGPGAVTRVPRSNMGCVDVSHGALDVEVRIDVTGGELCYEDVRTEELQAIITAGGIEVADTEPADNGWEPPPPSVLPGAYRPDEGLAGERALGWPSLLDPADAPTASPPDPSSTSPGSTVAYRSWLDASLGVPAAAPMVVPGTLLLTSTGSTLGDGVGDAIARQALRERLLRTLTDRRSRGAELQRALLTIMVRLATTRQAAVTAPRRRATTSARQPKRSGLPTPVSPAPASAPAEGADIASAEADEPTGPGAAPDERTAKRRRKKGKQRARKEREGANTERAGSSAAPANDGPRGPNDTTATAESEPRRALRWALWMLVPICALPGWWVHPSVALLGAILGFVVASSILDSVRRRQSPLRSTPSSERD